MTTETPSEDAPQNTTPVTPDERLAAAVQAQQLAAVLDRRIAAAQDRAEASATSATAAAVTLSREERDVTALDSLSWSRILSTLRGSRTSDLDREKAEAEAARYTAGVARACSASDRDEARALQAQRAALGDVGLAHEEALVAKEHWLGQRDDPSARRLAEIAVERGTLDAEDRESREAYDAGVAAHRHLTQAAVTLDSARSWSSWDTFGGGGLFTDLMKYDRLDDVGRELSAAEKSLRAFTNELADVHLPAAALLDIDSLTSTFDVWFDNIFTDWAVRERIIDAQRKVTCAVAEVATTVDRIRERRSEIAARLEELATERAVLLGG